MLKSQLFIHLRSLHKQFCSVAGIVSEFDCAGSRGFARVCAGLRGFARVRAGSRGFARVCAGSRGFARVCAGLCGFARVRPGSCGCARVRAGLCGFDDDDDYFNDYHDYIMMMSQ